MDFEVKLPLFEGPFDLLLFFIERDELDIYDIPIAKITQDFLAYMQQMEVMNIEVASEFIVVAATLMRIKSKMLLPRNQENPTEDPRQELIQSLLEYKKFKSLMPIFEQMEDEQMLKENRGNIEKELQNIAQNNQLELELYHLDLYQLMRVYQRMLVRYDEKIKIVRHTIVPHPYTVSGQREYLVQRLQFRQRVSFSEIISDYVVHTKLAAIYNFLAILEMLQNRIINIEIEEGFNNFWIEKLEEIPENIITTTT
ncbi:MAG: chromosome segregation protein ScpA [Cytophagales bacterium]|nr:MAG: chromosome segregation protein ScpA [Cytophagales bacterium]